VRPVVIVGVGVTKCGKFLDVSLGDLAVEAVWGAIKDTDIDPKAIQLAYVANTMAFPVTGGGGTLGEKVLAHCGFGGMPVVNVENSCCGGTTALRGAFLEVASGNCDIALALGVEKMYSGDTSKTLTAMQGGNPYSGMGFQFSGNYAIGLRRYMRESGATREHFAKVAVKNSYNGSLNPYAQHQRSLTIEQVLSSRPIADPLTLYMCCSMGDGAAAVIVCAKDVAKRFARKPLVEVAYCALRSGSYRKIHGLDVPLPTLAANEAYEKAGIGPEDIDIAEVHDAMAPQELILYEQLGFCKSGEGARLIDDGRTKINGDIPVNTSGGLSSRGDPTGATGLYQTAELVWQLRGEAGPRQAENNPKVGLIQNQGGYTEFDRTSVNSVVILKN